MQYIKEMNKTKDEITCNTCKGKLIWTDVDLVCINCGRVADSAEDGNTITVVKGVQHTDKTPALKQGRKKIEVISNVLGISESVTEKGYEIFYKCEKQKMLTGRSSPIFAAACLFVACRKAGLVWQIKDFINSGKIKEKIFVAYYKIIIQALEITPEIISPIQHISRIADKAEPPLNGIIQKQAIDIINQLDENAGKDPVSIAAAALCYVVQLKKMKYYLIKFPILKSENKTNKRIHDRKFPTIPEAESFILDPSNKWLSEHGVPNIIKVENTLRQIARAAEISEGTVRNRIKDIKKQMIKK